MAKLQGFKQAELALKALQRSMAAEHARKHVRKGAKVLSDEAAQNAHSADPSAELSAAMGVVNNPDDPSGVYVTARRGKRHPKGYIAHIVEHGAAPHLIKPKKPGEVLKFNGGAFPFVNHPGVKPSPFMRPAWDTKKEEALRKIGDSIKKELTKK